MGRAVKRRSATRPRDGPDRGLKAHGYRHTVAPRPGRRVQTNDSPTENSEEPNSETGGGKLIRGAVNSGRATLSALQGGWRMSECFNYCENQMKASMKQNYQLVRWLVTSLLVLNGTLFEGRTQISDDFLDGDDQGWVHFDPLASSGGGAAYSFPPNETPFGLDHRYRIEADASPDPIQYGPARAGSFRFDVPSGAAGVSWLVTGWDAAKSQTFGGFAGVHFNADQTFDGFGFTYSTSGTLSILRLDNGVSTTLASTSITVDSALMYRFFLSLSSGGGLGGVLFEVTNVSTPIARIDAIDPTFVNGASGLYLFSNEPTSGIGATFDNFGVGIVPEPSILSILALGGLCAFWAGRSRLHR